jgi:hypothetical protein
MKFYEYIRCDATALSEHVASGAVSPEELLKCALVEQSVRANPKTNAICLSMESQARKRYRRCRQRCRRLAGFLLQTARIEARAFFVLTAPVFAFSQLADSQVKV